jgi:hypothetical protein
MFREGTEKISPEENGPNMGSLTFYESLKKGPLEKFYNYGIYPWKLTITILLVIFTICQSVLIINRITTYKRACLRTLYNLFLESEDRTDIKYNRKLYLYTTEQIKQHINSSIQVILKIHFRITIIWNYSVWIKYFSLIQNPIRLWNFNI